MGVLANGKHETFARAVAGGETIVDSYVKAGYPRNRSNACRLRLNERIKARIDELRSFKTAAVEAAALSAAERAGVDHYWVVRTLRVNAARAMRRGDLAAANRAAELIGKHLGMFIDRKQIEIAYVDDADAYLAQLMEIVNAKTIEHEDVQPADKCGSEDGLDQDS
jgi:hypothetical protein